MTDYDPVVDAFRSVWEAWAILHGDDPDKAIEGHKRLCDWMDDAPIEAYSEDV